MNGIGFAAAAGIGFGLFQVANRRANQEIDAFRATFLLLVIGAAGLTVWTVTTRDLGVLGTAPVSSFLYFVAAGVVHFFLGWTFLSLSQQRVGAATTGAVLGSTPLVGSLLAAAFLGEGLSPIALLGILLVGAGVATMSAARAGDVSLFKKVPWFALAAATTWGASPLFIRWGLAGLDDPLIGVTIGLLSASVAYGIALVATRSRRAAAPMPRSGLIWVGVAGVLVAVCIAFQWIAFDLITIAVAITLMQLAAPTVILVAPRVVGTEAEKLTPALIFGAIAVLSGSVLVVLAA